MIRTILSSVSLAAMAAALPLSAYAGDDASAARMAEMEARLLQLEALNVQLIHELKANQQKSVFDSPAVFQPAHAVAQHTPAQHKTVQHKASHGGHHAGDVDPHHVEVVAPTKSGLRGRKKGHDGFVGLNSKYSYIVLDHAENTNTKQLVQLKARASGELENKVTVSGGLTALLNYQRSNTDDKFGYLMRNPTSNNQIGKDVSEAVIHSAQLGLTANLTDNLTAYMEFLYNPQQSFGQGTITDIERNQIQLRRAYLMYGDLLSSPIYAAIGKMDTPFGLNDTVNPFTLSSNSHAFAGLAYGAQLGYYGHGLHIRAMAIQGGSQFRAHNVPVKGTNVPSRLNNFAIDANYTHHFGDYNSILIGGSYTHGSAYCQEYPVLHFGACDEANPAYAAYGKLNFGDLMLLAEYASTTEDWVGTAVPDPTNPLSVFEAVAPAALTIGGRYAFDIAGGHNNLLASLEFSSFEAGDEGAPWEKQDQYVAGLSYFPVEHVNVFGEYVRADGFVPLNFLSGGNFPDGSTWSDQDVSTDVVMLGVQAAF